MVNLLETHAVFFDVDGVILDSVKVKTLAFAQMFNKYGPEVETAVVAYHLGHGGVSRYEKFRYYYSELLKLPLSEENLALLCKEFSELVLAKVLDSAFIPGALETLQKLSLLDIPTYVVSGTPEDELRYILEKRNISKYFVEIRGAPCSKIDIVKDILQRNKYIPRCCWFFGDATTDLDAAHDNGVNFVGIVSENACSPFVEGTIVSRRVDLSPILLSHL